MVKPGYKQTEVGIVPEDWEIKQFSQLFIIGHGKDQKGIESKVGKHPILATGGVVGYTNSYLWDKPSALIGRKGTINKPQYIDTPFWTIDTLFYTKILDVAFPKYIYYLFCTIDWLSLNEASGVPSLSANNIEKIICAVPSFDEQKRIAEALSDVDSMIFSLEKLIAKKKAVKQGTIQELLTGKKRLPGFAGNVEYKPLSSLCTVFADGDWIESKDQSNDGIRLIQTGNIGSGKYLDKADKQRFISEDTFNHLKCLEIFENDVLVSRLPDPAGRACILPWSNKRRITAVDCTIIRFVNYNPILFVAYSQTKEYQDKVDMAMAGSTRQRISRKELGEVLVPVFPSEKEQNAIASILSDVDNEIEALEQKLAKTKLIKQGMMRQLLTGKIRLVDVEDNKEVFDVAKKPHAEKKHNHQFDDAVMIAGIVNAFYTEKYPLGRKKVQKLLYLLKRKQEADTSAFKKKAAGPYADEVRYKGGEPIAKTNRYVQATTNKYGTNFSKGEKIQDALDYIEKWEMQPYIDWLLENFQYTKTNDLELYATIDMAICDLEEEGIEVSVDSIKNLIASNKEWKEKLSKSYFSDKDIARAIMMCKKVL